MRKKQVFLALRNDTRHLAFRFLPSPLLSLFLSNFFPLLEIFLSFISVGKVSGKALTVIGFDVRKCMWVVEQDFDGFFGSTTRFVLSLVLFCLFSNLVDWIVLILAWNERYLFPVQVRWQRLPWPFLMMTSQAVRGTWNRMSHSSVASQTLPMTKWADNQVNQCHYQVYQYSCRPGKSAGKLSRSRHDYLTINEWGWVSYEELWRPRRVLSVEAVGWGG